MLTCEVCGGKKLIKIPRVETIIQCQNCGFGRLVKMPPKTKVKKIYEKKYFTDKKGEEYYLDSLRKFNFCKKYLNKKSKVLDFGCGMGQFASLVKKAGHQVRGFDISYYSRVYVGEKYNIDVGVGVFNKNTFKKGEFDAIFSFDVIEHTVDYRKMVECFHHWLKKDGYLVISTPNIESWDKKVFKSKWWGFAKQKEHLVYFTPTSIKIILESAGFKVKCVKNWGFVRSVMFVLKSIFKNKLKKGFLIKTLNLIGFQKLFIYFPMHNMIVVAKK